MSRIKKSRKSAPLATSKKDAPQNVKAPKVQAAKKRKGLASGTRHNVAAQLDEANKLNKKALDSRIGSKKPIDLTPPVQNKVVSAQSKPSKGEYTPTPKAKLSKVTPVLDMSEQWLQELKELEQDVELNTLLDRMEQEEELSAQELTYVNKKTERHSFLIDKLGMAEEDEELDDNGDSEERDILDDWENSSIEKDWS